MRINNSRGFAHYVLLILVAVGMAVAGVGYMVASHAQTPSTMYDSAAPDRIPADAKVVASYVGSQQGYQLAKQRFPNAIVISINETPGNNEAADIWGIEPGAKTITETVGAIANGTARGAYGTQSDLNAVRAGLNARDISRSSYVLWLSGAGTQDFTSIPAGDDAHQFKYVAGRYDVSTISPTFLSRLNAKARTTAAPKKAKPVKAKPVINSKLGSKYYIYTANKLYTSVTITSSQGFGTAKCNNRKIPNGKSTKLATKPKLASDSKTYLPVPIDCATPLTTNDSYSVTFFRGSSPDADPVVIDTTTPSCLYVHSSHAANKQGITKTFLRQANGSCSANAESD